MKAKTTETEMNVISINRRTVDITLRGTTPIIFNKLSEKARQELLLPAGRKTTSQKASTLKHDPVDEYRRSAHMDIEPDAPTRILMPTVAFKAAMRTATSDQPSTVTKAGIGRLVYMPDEYVSIYGVPELRMDMVRLAGMNRTPDVRTRMTIRDWCCTIRVSYSDPLIKLPTIVALMGAAGITCGVGDWRPEKGSGNFGQFELVQPAAVEHLVEHCGREVQDEAIAHPTYANVETRELLEWFNLETDARGVVVPSQKESTLNWSEIAA